MKTHPQLLPLLEQHGLTLEMFRKRGRPPKGVREKRSALVTELHQKGCTWVEMMEITGLSNGAIQRLTKAMWNEASRKNRQESASRTGHARSGEKKPWLSDQLRARWGAGDFDFHRGRVRSPEECEVLRAAWTPERRAQAARRVQEKVWGNPEVKKHLLAFHRSSEERARRSKAQVIRMQENPNKYLRGRASWVGTPKGTKDRVYVRSSYEKAAVTVLERLSNVTLYEYERRFELPDGKWVLPDFLVTWQNGSKTLIEVKAAWVLKLPASDKVQMRLKVAEHLADSQGWGFEIWTEKELDNAL